jgi:hypothetical protein
MKKAHNFPKFPAILILLALVLAGCLTGYLYRLDKINSAFQRESQYADWNWNRPKDIQKLLEDTSIDLTMPALSGEVTFTAPCNFTYWNHYVAYKVKKGTELTCNFVTYSRKSGSASQRITVMTVDGKETEAAIRARDMAKLYKAALEQNGLTEQFEEDFGKRLTLRSARQALRSIDAQLYEAGMLNPGDYPFDRSVWEAFLEVSILLAPLILLVLTVLVAFLTQVFQYRLFLADYNQEHTENWDKISGTLPEFQSLKNSGINMAPKPILKKPSIADVCKKLFQTPTKNGK